MPAGNPSHAFLFRIFLAVAYSAVAPAKFDCRRYSSRALCAYMNIPRVANNGYSTLRCRTPQKNGNHPPISIAMNSVRQKFPTLPNKWIIGSIIAISLV